MDAKARTTRFFSQLLMILVGIVVIYLVMDFGRQVMAMHRVHRELDELQARLDDVLEEQRQLEGKVRYAYSEQAVHDWALRHGLVKENEVAITIVDLATTPEPPILETPRTSPASIPARRIWWDLFFAQQ